MVVDYLIKPLNSTPFRNICNAIIRLEELSIGQCKAKYENTKQAYHNQFGVWRKITLRLTLMINQNVGVCWDPNMRPGNNCVD